MFVCDVLVWKKEKNMGNSCICLYKMENDLEGCMDSNVSSWCVFYLKCDKGRDNSSFFLL
jgi:hypothetical protein